MDFVALWGRRVCVLLPETPAHGAYIGGSNIYRALSGNPFLMKMSEVSPHVTISLGITVYTGGSI
jgi:PleD family two-component response regulator